MNYVEKIRRHGLVGSARKAAQLAMKKTGWNTWRVRNAPKYKNPSREELVQIENDLRAIGVEVEDYSPPPRDFKSFQSQDYFADHYHGGPNGEVWYEKVLEHWIASLRLELMQFGKDEIYIDFAAASSPWA